MSYSTGMCCCAINCHSYFYMKGKRSEFSFFGFPKDKSRRNRWCNLIKRTHGRDNFNADTAKICHKHFHKSNLIHGLGSCKKIMLRKGAEPIPYYNKETKERKAPTPCSTTLISCNKSTPPTPHQGTPISKRKNPFSQVHMSIRESIKEEPKDDDYVDISWQHSPTGAEEDKEHCGEEEGQNNTKDAAEIRDKRKHSHISTQQNAAISTPTTLPTGSGTAVSIVSASPDMNSATKKLRMQLPPGAPKNMQVKVIQACSKCTPIVRQLANQANTAQKDKSQIAKELDESTKRLQQLLQESKIRTRALQFEVKSLSKDGLSFCEQVLASDSSIESFCGIQDSQKFDYLYEKTMGCLNPTETIRLNSMKLTYKEQFVLTLMCIRSNPPFRELAYRFQSRITPSFVGEVLGAWLPLLADELKSKILACQKRMQYLSFPPCFNSVGRNLRGILHRFEITRQKPPIWDVGQTSLCLKFLTLFSPNGEVISVSQVVDETVLDSDLFVQSGIADFLSSTNIVVDTQKLGLKDHVKFGIKVIEPPLSNELNNMQIQHVESIVEKMLDFRIVQGPLSCAVTKEMMDNIVLICAGLINLK